MWLHWNASPFVNKNYVNGIRFSVEINKASDLTTDRLYICDSAANMYCISGSVCTIGGLMGGREAP